MADVFQEVDEMMKQERVEKFWKENGRWIIAFVVLTILGTALMSGYKSWNKSVQEKQTGELIAFLDAEDFPNGLDDAIKDYDIDLTKSFVVGDGLVDMQLAQNSKCRGIFIGNINSTVNKLFLEKKIKPYYIAHDLLEAANHIKDLEHSNL